MSNFGKGLREAGNIQSLNSHYRNMLSAPVSYSWANRVQEVLFLGHFYETGQTRKHGFMHACMYIKNCTCETKYVSI